MIFVDRTSAVSIPSEWPGRALAEEQIAHYYSQLEKGLAQSRLDFERFINRFYRAFRPAVTTLFRNKCAYCESPLGITGVGDMELFRPKQAASDLSGAGSIGHYGWLSIEWENLYITCRVCNVSKKNLFPLEGPRGALRTPLATLRKTEKPLLIDPCFDEPGEHLLFLDDGKLKPMTRKGETTLTVLRLNRPDLVKARAQVVTALAEAVAAYAASSGKSRKAAAAIAKAVGAEAPYAGTARAFVARQADRLARLPEISGLGADLFTRRRASARPEARDFARSAPTQITEEEQLRLDARPLKAVTIVNFKLLRDFHMEFPEPGDQAPWLILLGENATGKSAVLLAVALALAGAKAANRHLRPADVLHRGAEQGKVELSFWDSDECATLSFRRGDPKFSGTIAPSVLALAYGSLRIPGRERSRGVRPDSPNSHIAGITGAVATLPNPQPWLRSLPRPAFDAVARVLKSVLLVDDDAVLKRRGHRISFLTGGNTASLNELSAGYGAMVAMAIDILTVLLKRWSLPEAAEGFVIIDELESHLHPRWKMRIVDAFRRCLPRVQFLVSTHDPLVLRGVKNGEVRLMRRHAEAGAVALDQLPNVEGLRVDQLLTSEHFGLSSTIDPGLEGDYERYYHLLSVAEPTPAEQAELDGLRERLGQKGQMGGNRRERLMYEAIDTFLAGGADAPAADVPGEELARELRKLWEEA